MERLVRINYDSISRKFSVSTLVESHTSVVGIHTRALMRLGLLLIGHILWPLEREGCSSKARLLCGGCRILDVLVLLHEEDFVDLVDVGGHPLHVVLQSSSSGLGE